MSLLGHARASALYALDRADHLLSIGAREGLLGAALATGALPFSDQIAITGSFARRATLGLVDADVSPDLAWPSDGSGLAAFLEGIRGEVEAVSGDPLPSIRHRAGDAELIQRPEIYVTRFALPNMWFHLSVAHAILRTRGVAVGKADFDGWHKYGRR